MIISRTVHAEDNCLGSEFPKYFQFLECTLRMRLSFKTDGTTRVKRLLKTVNNCKRMLAAQWKRQDAEHTFKDTMSQYFRALTFWTANIPLRSLFQTPQKCEQFCEFAHNGNSRRSVWLSAVQDNAKFDSVLSRTMLSLTQRCPGQCSVWLSAVQDNAQFDSV